MSESSAASKTKKSITQALHEMMLAKPYKDISVSEIARKVGISRQAFYLHFDDKDAVLIHQFSGFFTLIMDDIREHSISTLEQLVAVYTSLVRKYAEELRILADNNLGGMLGDFLVTRFVDLPPVLPQQRQSRSKTEHRYVNSFWIHAIIQVYTLWVEENMKTPDEEIERILVDIMRGNYFSKQ